MENKEIVKKTILTKIIDKETNDYIEKLGTIFNIKTRSKVVKHLCKLYLDKLGQ